MSTRPWYPRYPRDFRAKTLHLNLTERGAYDALIDHYYEVGQSLPAEADALYRIAGAFTDQDRAAVDRVSKEFFTNGDGRLTNIRCEEEIEKMRARSAQQSELAQRRWNPKADATAMPRHSDGISEGNASHSQRKTTTPSAAKPRRGARALFPIPDDFTLDQKTLAWCKERRMPVPELQARFDWFRDYARSSGKLYADWQAAFKNSVRANWAKITPQQEGKLAI